MVTKTRCREYRAPDGSIVIFSEPQRVALDRVELWAVRGYTYRTDAPSGARPTHSDAEIAAMIELHAPRRITQIRRKHWLYKGTHNCIVVDPRGGADIACASMSDACAVARSVGARVITMVTADWHPAYINYANEHSMTVLLV